jgi:hypothetical protein
MYRLREFQKSILKIGKGARSVVLGGTLALSRGTDQTDRFRCHGALERLSAGAE